MAGVTDSVTNGPPHKSKGHPEGWPVYVRVWEQNRRSADTRHRSGDDHCTTEFPLCQDSCRLSCRGVCNAPEVRLKAIVRPGIEISGETTSGA